VRLTTTERSRVDPGSVLDAAGRRLVVRASQPHHHRFIVDFDGVDTREAAEALSGTVLRAEVLDLDDPDDLWVHELIGATVVEGGLERGTVAAVQDNPASDLLVLDTGALVPLTFVVGWESPGRLEVEAPAGLFDLEA